MTTRSREPSRRYLVEFTEPALVDADAAYLWLSQQVGMEYAVRWYEGLFEAARTLSTLPRIHAVAPENDFYDVEVRRLLYYGPSGRRASPHRVLFYILEPQEDEAEGVVRVLHVIRQIGNLVNFSVVRSERDCGRSVQLLTRPIR